MIRPLAVFLHALDAARTAGTLTRTVLVLSRQLDNAHLLVASEGARADRAELREAELEAQTRDWAELSGELAREQPTADPLPDLADAGDAPTSVVDHARAAAYQCDRANALAATLHATEAIVLDLRARLATAEREAKEARAQLRQTEAAAGAHVATIARLQEQIAAAHRAAHAPSRSLEERADIARRAWDESPPADPGPVEWDELPPAGQAAWRAVVRACDTSAAHAEQTPGVAAADDPPCLCGHDAKEHGREGCQAAIFTGEVCACERFQRYGHHPRARATAADDPPPTRPSERTTAPRTT